MKRREKHVPDVVSKWESQRGVFLHILGVFVFQQELYCLDVVKPKEKDALRGLPESSYSDGLQAKTTTLRGDNGASFLG